MMSLLSLTLLVQSSAILAAAFPKLVRRAPDGSIGFVAVMFASVYWFPRRWSAMELISFGYLVAFVVFEIFVYLLLWATVVLVRNAREAASGG